MVLVKLRELKSRRGDEDEGPGTGGEVSKLWHGGRQGTYKPW